MSQKFKFVVEEMWHHSFEAYVEETFVNDHGTWDVEVRIDNHRDDTYFHFTLNLNPIRQQTAAALKELKVKLTFRKICIPEPDPDDETEDGYLQLSEECYNETVTVTQIRNWPAYSARLWSPWCYCDTQSFRMDIDVDASSLLLPITDEENNLLNYSKELFESKKFKDVTIKSSDGTKIKASKLFLSRSPVFDEILQKLDKKEGRYAIKINDIKHEVLEELVRYLHTDETPNLDKMALELLVAAEKYKLPGLQAQCGTFLKSNSIANLQITENNFATILKASDAGKVPDLKDKAVGFILDNLTSVFASDHWRVLKKTHYHLVAEVLERCSNKLK